MKKILIHKVLAAEAVLPKDPTKFSSVGGIINVIMPYVFVIAGLILLFMLILGGIQLMTSAGDPDKSKAGYGRITHALIGFLIVFIAYFVTELVGVMLGFDFLSG